MPQERSDAAKLMYGANKVGRITNLSFSIGGNSIPTSNFDTGLFEEFQLGRRNVTVSISGQIDREDTDGQVALLDDYLDGTKSKAADFLEFSIGPETPASGDVTFSGAGFPTDYSEERADDGDGLATFTAEIQISGTWTKAVAI